MQTLQAAPPDPDDDPILKRIPIQGGELIKFSPAADATDIIKSINIKERELTQELKEVLKGCEARVDITQIIQVIERPNERITVLKKKMSIAKDK